LTVLPRFNVKSMRMLCENMQIEMNSDEHREIKRCQIVPMCERRASELKLSRRFLMHLGSMNEKSRGVRSCLRVTIVALSRN
jgi:hypothetical protein